MYVEPLDGQVSTEPVEFIPSFIYVVVVSDQAKEIFLHLSHQPRINEVVVKYITNWLA